jgi:hypothetical protein
LYSLVVLCETNVLNLISQWLDTIYQIKPKRATVLFLHQFYNLNTPLNGFDQEGCHAETLDYTTSVYFSSSYIAFSVPKNLLGHAGSECVRLWPRWRGI